MRLTLSRLFAEDAALTMSELVERTGLSRRTLELILVELVAEGWAEEITPDVPRGVGRPPRSYAFRPEHALVAAVQVDSYAANAVVCDLHARVLVRRRRVLSDVDDPARTYAEVVEMLQAVEADARPIGPIAAIGFTSGGSFTADGELLSLIGSPRWSHQRPAEVLGARFEVPVVADNDANLAAVAERHLGAAQDAPTFLWLVAGKRAGAGILINDAVHHGFDGAAGEIVHAPQLGASSIATHPFGVLASPFPEDVARATELLAAARAGDEAVLAQLDDFAALLGGVVAILCWTIAPPLFVLGGGLGAASDVLLPRLERELSGSPFARPELRRTSLGDDAALLGAVLAARTRVGGDLRDAFDLRD